MARMFKALFVLSVGSWVFSLTLQSSLAQQPVEVPGEPISIADLGLESRIPSAIDLVGPEHSSAGRNRTALVRAFECWIDGVEDCSVAGLNDPRVRAIRVFLGQGPVDQDGVVDVRFPDESRIRVRIERVRDLDPDDWDQSIYEPVVIADSARAPGLAEIPSRPGQFEALAFDGPAAIEAALERLRQRLERRARSVDAPPRPDASSDRSAR